jgi:hypothetical protein
MHDAARGKLAVGLRSARVVHRRLVLRGTASRTGSISITIRRRPHRRAIEVIRVKLHGRAWTRSLALPRDLAAGAYDVVAGGAKTSFLLADG